MRIIKIFAALLLFSHPAYAEDIALIYGDTGQRPDMINPAGATFLNFASPLSIAGFRVIEPADRSSENMRKAAGEVVQLLSRGQVDRLVIVVLGPYAHNGRESWVLGNDAAGASSFSVPEKGIAINALSDLATQAKGRAVIMLAKGAKVADLGLGLQPGLGEFIRAENVTYITGRADQLVDITRNGLLEPGQSYSWLALSAPEGVEFSGFIGENEGLMGGLNLALETTRQPGNANSAKLIERGFWQAVEGIDSPEGYMLYLDRFPKGSHRLEAQAGLERIKSEPERLAREAENKLNLSRATRRKIQGDLALLGYDPQGIDGIFGKGSRAAIKAWQGERGFAQTGYLTAGQIPLLRDQALLRESELAEQARLQKEEQERQDENYWWQTGSSGKEEDLLKYLEKYPDGIYAAQANEMLDAYALERGEAPRAEQKAWDEAIEKDTIDGYQSFVDAYPDSRYKEDATTRISDLQQAQAHAQQVAEAKAQEQSVAGVRFARKIVEQKLAKRGFNPGKVDGKFTPATRQALQLFQKSKGLPVTGYVSRATMAKLMGL
jgi:peptidoglycan hydrolase-like protein with peptidoglycan-binding domain